MRCRQPGFQLEDLLKVLDRQGGLALGEVHPPSEEEAVQVGGVLLEEHVKGLGRLVILALGEGDLGDPVPRRKKLGSLLSDFSQELLPFGRPTRLKIKIGEDELSEMSLDRLRLVRDRFPEGALGRHEILLAEVEAPECEMELCSVRDVASRLFQAPDRCRDLLRGARAPPQNGQGLDVSRVLLEDERRFSLGLCWVASQEVDRCQLLSHLDVRGVEPLRLLQVVERRSRLSELVMSQPQLAGDPHVGGLNAEDVAVFDDGFSVLSPRKVLVTAVEMTGLLSLRRPRAPGHRDQDGQDTHDPAAG